MDQVHGRARIGLTRLSDNGMPPVLGGEEYNNQQEPRHTLVLKIEFQNSLIAFSRDCGWKRSLRLAR